jgi:hypothetical protein
MDPTFIEAVGAWLALAERYGLSVVLLVAAIIAIILMARWISRKFDAMWSMITEVKNTIPDPQQESVEEITRLNKGIRAVMREARTDFHCQWVHLWQFHNGSRVVGKNRIPFMFVSLTNEICDTESLPVMSEFGQVPTSMVMDMLFALISNELLAYKFEVAGFTDNPISKRMSELGVKEQYFIPIRDEDGNIVGVMELCFTFDPEMDDERRRSMKDYAQRIAIVLASFDRPVEEVIPKQYTEHHNASVV